jgi:superoxide dismutase, Fe-Mn family
VLIYHFCYTESMKQFTLPELPYALDGLAPHITQKTLEYHYGKHHAAYIKNLNDFLANSDDINKPIEDIVRASENGLFNNAAQAYNHTFYWYGMKPNSSDEDSAPSSHIAAALDESFGSYDKFRELFTETAVKHFGSGWAWLLKNKQGKLEVKGMHDALSPITDGDTPLLALDVWEHAYYLDYQNMRADYITAFYKLINWEFVEKQLLAPSPEPLMLAEDIATA